MNHCEIDELSDAIVAVALANSQNLDYDSESDEEYSSSSSNYDFDLDQLFHQQRPRAIMGSRFETVSLLNSGRNRDNTMLQRKKIRSFNVNNNRLVGCLVLSVLCAVFLYDHKNKAATNDEASDKDAGIFTGNFIDKIDKNIQNTETIPKKENSETEINSNHSKGVGVSLHGAPADASHKIEKNEQKKETGDVLSGFSSIGVPYNPTIDIPVYWDLPMAGSQTLSEVLNRCYGLVEASERGAHEDHGELRVVTLDSSKHVNVDMSSPRGIANAQKMGLIQSNLTDIIATAYIHETSNIFLEVNRKAKCFTIIRHPIHRAISLFYYLQRKARSSPKLGSKAYQHMTIEEYAKGRFCEENRMTRLLTNEKEKSLESYHLDMAIDFLKNKCVTGIYDDFSRSMRRFRNFFQWNQQNEGCDAYLIEGEINANNHDEIKVGSDVWNLFKENNIYDLKLYYTAKELFANQTIFG